LSEVYLSVLYQWAYTRSCQLCLSVVRAINLVSLPAL